MIQTAKDAMGRGFLETRKDVVSAQMFFFSTSQTHVQQRHVWFGMAGVPEPEREGMERMVAGLVRVGSNPRRGG